jgi:hypothetical protein
MNPKSSLSKLAAMALLATLCFSAPRASAVLLWDYSTTDGSTTISGRLVTDGSSADLSGPFTFRVLELKSVLLDNVPAAFTEDLATFDLGPGGGTFAWNGVASTPPVFILATSAGGGNLVEIDLNVDDPENPFFSSRVVVAEAETKFVPVDTRFTPVLEQAKVAESSSFGWVFGAGLLALHWRNRLRTAKHA